MKNTVSEDQSLDPDILAPIEEIELVIGLVGPTGTDLDIIIKELSVQLKNMGYETIDISLSKLILEMSQTGEQKLSCEYERVKFLMNEGTKLREQNKLGDFVARLAIAEIRRQRKKITGESGMPAKKKAYILKSFKRREEVDLFKIVYGQAFTLISVYSSIEDRLNSLSKKLANTCGKLVDQVKHQALELINIDLEEEKDFGQDVRNTFPLADYFVSLEDPSKLKSQLLRLVQLIFENPSLTPSKDEYAMYFAQAAALRSGDLSRQVGAAIVSMDGDILVVGCNEVPKFGGGLYWVDDQSPARDLEIGYDKNDKIKQEIVRELIQKLRSNNWFVQSISNKSDDELYAESVLDKNGFLKETQILNVIEFGRAVHAEMAAISEAAKRGISVKGSRLFCTTFPCHLCARHIISSGISEVVYIEPYPKSRTEELYADSVVVNSKNKILNKVNFKPFVGVAPRKYFEFFQFSGKRKNKDGDLSEWEKRPRTKIFILSHIMLEVKIVSSLPSKQL